MTTSTPTLANFLATYQTPLTWIMATLVFLGVVIMFYRIGHAIVQWYNKNKIY